MERIKLGDLVVPLCNIDVVYINDTDKRKLCVHTLGDFTVNSTFDSEETCKKNFEEVIKMIDEYQPCRYIKVVGNGTDGTDNERSV